MAKRYRKKPVEVEAIQFTEESRDDIIRWVLGAGGNIESDKWGGEGPVFLRILTLEGKMNASLGDYIIRGVQGEFYPCKPDIFEQSYEVVE